MYSLFADIVVGIHFLWILFLIFGAIPGSRFMWVRILHICSLIFSVTLQLNNWICPLTHLEVWLRARSGWIYSGGFIRHYVEKLVYLEAPHWVTFAGTLVVIAVTALIYLRTITGTQDKEGNRS